MMKFLKRFWIILIDYFTHKFGNTLNKTVREDEILSRYLLSTRLFSSENNRVKHNAFLPPPSLKLSVFRTENLAEAKIWEIGLKRVVKRITPRKNLYGRADIRSWNVLGLGLEINADNDPPRHANIVNWPDEKPKQKEIALELASRASLKLRPN